MRVLWLTSVLSLLIGCSDSAPSAAAPPPGATGWAGERVVIDNTTSIHGLTPMVIGSPVVTPGEHGDALCFDGDDGLVLDANPLEGLDAFTLEVLFQPHPVASSEVELSEPRFLHIETADAARATLEARVNEADFHLDTYLLSAGQSLTLIDASKVHPVGPWYWAALTYANGDMRHFVDGVEDAAGSVVIAPLGAGKVSIGVRQNLRYWFKGCVRELLVTAQALEGDELQRDATP